ncbi:hypothetical protein GZ78_08380 [Endozoicomonas numazuensis]|uniref:Uncharacterized protein n=1 Tax=Endozoicomonas numazuensis TaxID=1137799 RepID=A0A081NGX7_9GAMM|nr:hypothetical protein GZ78_08380 [Endozoicomonas numazuensis]
MTVSTQFGQNGVDTFLVDDAHAFSGYTQANETLLALYPETLVVQIRHETTLGLVVRVGNVVPGNRALAGNLTNFGHNGGLSNQKNPAMRPEDSVVRFRAGLPKV